ncbi:MAG TPA: GGDEF domain-containing protein [Burkholderiales bacterium]|jgi:diguanylate cyclase (GGDEF)-like protein|nr:GGDEF domain-containing protein [Burkholderiales bacterium]
MSIHPHPAAGRGTGPSIEQEELRGISRTVAEIHWLLLILVLLYSIYGGDSTDKESEAAVLASCFFYAAFVLAFRYANFYRRESRWKVALETWAMIAFITWVLYFSGGLSSPLINTYLLPVITAALTLGKLTTLVEVALIAACHVYLGGITMDRLFTLNFLGGFAAQIAPVLLVAYIVTMFSADIRYGLNRAKLLSETDELTGLLNMRGFSIAANRLFGQALRYNRPATLLMIDSDNLKAVNDNYGHDAGNRLLRQLTRTIQAELRYTDVLARYGGDEFIVLLPETPPRGALEVAERIRDAVIGAPLEVNEKRVVCSVSIGLACHPDDGNTMDALVARADRAMYKAKQDGRNKVVQFAAAAA